MQEKVLHLNYQIHQNKRNTKRIKTTRRDKNRSRKTRRFITIWVWFSKRKTNNDFKHERQTKKIYDKLSKEELTEYDAALRNEFDDIYNASSMISKSLQDKKEIWFNE